MTERIPFSQRHETRRPPEGLIYDRVPDRLYQGFQNILPQLARRLGIDVWQLALQICHRLDRQLPYPFDLGEFIEDLDWDELCDACEAIWERLDGPNRDWLSNEMNALFARRYFGYELRDGQMERVGARVHEEAIAEARGILRGPDLSGPDQQFQKAIGFFNRRPEPDCENCVKEAVSAVEGVAQVLLGDDSLMLSEALKRLRKQKDVHPTLLVLLDKLYGYRSDAEGVAHALTGEKEVRIEEAEFVLGVSASAIVYLARLFGRAVE